MPTLMQKKAAHINAVIPNFRPFYFGSMPILLNPNTDIAPTTEKKPPSINTHTHTDTDTEIYHPAF